MLCLLVRYKHYLVTDQSDKIPGIFAFEASSLKIEMADSGLYGDPEGFVALYKLLSAN